MAQATQCFEVLLQGKVPKEIPAVVVAFGDDGFLRKETVQSMLALWQLDPELVRSYDGEECRWLDVHDELATLSLFEADARRIASVSRADKLVKDARLQLEKWCSSPPSSSLLLLQLSSFPASTKLYKLVAKSGWCVQCSIPTAGGRSKSPDLGKLKDWIAAWAQSRHSLKLNARQTTQILEAVGTDCGILHQELSKLALYADPEGTITSQALRENLGTWRTRTMWEIADAIADGKTAEALTQLEKVFAAGEHPAAVVPQVAWSLRRYGRAAHLILQSKRIGRPLAAEAAIGQCGFWGADVKRAEDRLRRLGLKRASCILDWLLELDLQIKGSHSHPNRAIFAIEQLCFKFA